MWPDGCSYVSRRRFASVMARATLVISTLIACAHAQTTDRTCEVRISSPAPGDKVGSAGRVRGTAKIPSGTFLWVFLHMKDLILEWWPQGGRAAIINEDGSWVMVVGYGQQRDLNEEFEVVAAVVDSTINTKLRKDFNRAQFSDGCCDFPPIEFPKTVDGCPRVKVTVLKTSHF